MDREDNSFCSNFYGNFYGGYMDYNSSVPMPPEVRREVEFSLKHDFGNGSSVHRVGRGLASRVNDVRDKVAEFLSCESAEIIFTSGATESNNFLLGVSSLDRILVGVDGHESLIQPVLRLTEDKEIQFIGLNRDGTIDIEQLERHLSESPRQKTLVALTLANSETGVVQDVAVLSSLVKDYGGWLHLDAVQALGTIEVDVKNRGVDSMSISGHKIGAMSGIGVLYVSDDKMRQLRALHEGGGQERGLRSGSYNVPGIVSMGAAIDWLRKKQKSHESQRLSELKVYLEEGLKKIDSGVLIIGEQTRRLPHVSSIIMTKLDSQSWLVEMDLSGVYISTGSACSSGKVGDSNTLKEMGFDLQMRKKFIRVSLGWASSKGDVEKFLEVVNRVYERRG